MVIKAKLFTTRGIWQADAAYIYAANDLLTVSFGAEHAGELVTARNGAVTDSFRISEEGDIAIPAGLLGTGALKIVVRSFIGERCVGEWIVDPLSVVRFGDDLKLTPWTVAVEERLEDLENAVFGQSSPLFE